MPFSGCFKGSQKEHFTICLRRFDSAKDMIQVAKERAEQRRHLSDATEEVREQARALEELLAREQAATEFVQAV